ncbi:hypothetical protein [Paracoccus saliphilus]|uniref:Uncharacterized protein n=1 Tax=Paracoccus saliphilus TaxID=405559 RepID=A0AA45W1I5_9RHOB|nr:hypothetical protein [Paracoccus saliphilus]WCR03650.1 hypothetical protein JHX88_02410 [Paracoccus saliphilus]SIS57262.1 hypothetical protein SAMN05421772_101558 [Paracoccus saliphilus]
MRHRAIALLSSVLLTFSGFSAFSQTDDSTADIPAPTEDSDDSADIRTQTDIVDSILLELNGATSTEAGGCQLTVVTTNRLDQDLDRAAWQVAIFDAAGVVQSLPILDFGAMVSGKTKVAMFELPDRGCTDIGQIIVNDVAACTTGDGKDLRNACLTGLATQSRTDIDFGL